MSRRETSISFGIGLLIGVLAGVGAGILYAPKSGEETRNDLKEKTNQLMEKGYNVENFKKTGLEMIEKAKISIENQISKINQDIKASKLAKAKAKELIESEEMMGD